MDTVERAGAAAEARLEAANALPAACLRQAFPASGRDTWTRRRLPDVCQLLPSSSVSSFGDTAVRVITTACLTETGFRASGIKPASMWASDARESLVSAGEILIARSNTTELVGRAAMFPGNPPGVVASDLTIRIKTGPELIPAFLAAYFSYLYVTGYWKSRAGGASGSMKKITRSQLEEQRLPVPPLGDQERLAAHLQEQLDAAERISRAIEQERAAIEALPGTLLHLAFSGHL